MSAHLTRFIEQELRHRLPGLEIKQLAPYELPSFIVDGQPLIPPQLPVYSLNLAVEFGTPHEEQVMNQIVHMFGNSSINERCYLFHCGFYKRPSGHVHSVIAVAAAARTK
jgi:hypothetical protein